MNHISLLDDYAGAHKTSGVTTKWAESRDAVPRCISDATPRVQDNLNGMM
jgi:hypothetical protein